MIFEKAYEKYKLYRGNPCDVGAWPWLKPFGCALAKFATSCPCCNGARMLALALLAALFPTYTWIAIGVVYLVLLICQWLDNILAWPDLE